MKESEGKESGGKWWKEDEIEDDGAWVERVGKRMKRGSGRKWRKSVT